MGLCLALGLNAQRKSSFKVGGPCMVCGASRMIGIVKVIDGVAGAEYDAATSMLAVDFDPVAASLIDIQLELSIHGYDAGDFLHDTHYKLPECALAGGMRGDQTLDELPEPGIDDIEGLDADGDWENIDPNDLVGDSGDDDLDLLDEENDDDDILSDFVDDDGDSVDDRVNLDDGPDADDPDE